MTDGEPGHHVQWERVKMLPDTGWGKGTQDSPRILKDVPELGNKTNVQTSGPNDWLFHNLSYNHLCPVNNTA